ncbi:MAG: hypothetical protein GOU98_01370 [Candidatus Altiarchaeota archaeon]|nr:hypothetical protein [Candidatus Altiarchaeota archaeon]
MKKIILGVLVFGVVLFLTNSLVSANDSKQEVLTKTVGQATNRAILQIDDMTCTSCAAGVEWQLQQVEGVVNATVVYSEGKGYVDYDASIVDAETIAKASDVYPARVIENKGLN